MEPRSHWERVLAVQEATGTRRLSKGSWSHTATIRQLEGAGPIYGPGGVGERHWRYTGVDKTFGKRYSFASGKMKSAPHQRVSVAQCDHTTAGRRRTYFSPGGFGERQRRSTGVDKTFGKRYSFARGKMESGPRHWVTVAHCDHKTPGRRQTPFLTVRLWKASLEVNWSTEVV